MRQISTKDVENIRIGQAENLSAGTGCTVVICDRGAPTGLDTSADEDSVYAMSVGSVQADMDMVGTLAADVMSEAILSAVKNAETAYGYISANDFLTEY